MLRLFILTDLLRNKTEIIKDLENFIYSKKDKEKLTNKGDFHTGRTLQDT